MMSSNLKRPVSKSRIDLFSSVAWIPALLILSTAACSSPSSGGSAQAANSVAWFEGLARDGVPEGQDPGAWTEWLATPWQGSDGEAPSFHVSRLTCPGGECEIAEETTVDTCQALFDADLRNLEADREERASYQDWRLKCYAGRAIGQAVPARQSFVADFHMDDGGYRRLPVALGFPSGPEQIGEIQEIRSSDGDLGDFIDQALSDVKPAALADGAPRQVSLEDDEDWIRSWTWLARGDINQDGFEDLLVSVSLHDGVTTELYAHRLFVVEKQSADAPLSLAQEIPLVPGDIVCDPYVSHCERDIVRGTKAE